jgi:flagellar hook-basal body complex protein FliE
MVAAIGSAAIQEMLAQMRSAVDQTRNSTGAVPGVARPLANTNKPAKSDFAQALKTHLGEVSNIEKPANSLGKRFALGDIDVNLSDVMVSTQKVNIALQSTVQVRNKLASAYQAIMSMQI